MPQYLRTALAATAAAALTGGLLALSATTASAAPAKAPGRADADFNNDGYADVAVSAPLAYVSGKKEAGAVTVIYGGKTANRYATYSQNSAGVPGNAEAADRFGSDTAFGDFDGDGYDDLAVGTPGEDVGSDKDGGSTVILWGSASGLKGGTEVKDPRPSSHDMFGGNLEAADFNGDHKDDLAVGTASGNTTIDVVRGGFTRTSGTGKGSYTVTPALWSGKGNGITGLHSGDVNGDGREDLIVDGFAKDDDYNANFWLPGSASGVTTKGAQKLPGGLITDVGDTNGDGLGDIVIGLVWDSGIAHAHTGGTALIVKGNKAGPAGGGIQTFTQDTAGVPGAGEKNDMFGYELDLGDVNGDGHLDLVVGAANETVNGRTGTGSVTVLYGAANGSGITGQGARFLSQDTAGVPNSDEAYDGFGGEVHVDDLDHDGRGDVIVGASGENDGNGAVYALHSNTNGTLTSPAGIYTSTAGVGISASGKPAFGLNFAD
ncbi:VCBS repeat-containing protein [Streptomyces sp. NPDC049954]|uniref:VCBS repeat-containing protein n=1 Tax=Streptomyces sp. NPDC049954 TaxID=3155779 RepID=UPI003441E3EB